MDTTGLTVALILGAALGWMNERLIPLSARVSRVVLLPLSVAATVIIVVLIDVPPDVAGLGLGYAAGFGFSWARRAALEHRSQSGG